MHYEAPSATNPFPITELSGLKDHERVSLCEALDRVLNKGAVVVGEITISVADIDLVYLGLQLVLTSMETREGLQRGAAGAGLTIDIAGERTYDNR
jgi:Gas vesicle protein